MMNSLPARIGRLRERVTLQQVSVSIDAAGDPAYAWTDVATLWARVRPSGGGVATLAERRTAIEDYEVTIRWRDGMSVTQRFVWRGRYLQIESVANLDERRQRVTLACKDLGVDAGVTA
jgi:SPP1 family predicted phage head-tail adaptor